MKKFQSILFPALLYLSRTLIALSLIPVLYIFILPASLALFLTAGAAGKKMDPGEEKNRLEKSARNFRTAFIVNGTLAGILLFHSWVCNTSPIYREAEKEHRLYQDQSEEKNSTDPASLSVRKKAE